jgi:outer membrane biosynthesis protein TonB
VLCTRYQEIDLAEFAVDPRALGWAEFRDHFPRCRECSREVARFGALDSALRADGAGSSAHPSDEALFAFAAGSPSLARDERARLEAHLAGCSPCRSELGAAQRLRAAAVPAAHPGPSWLERIGAMLAGWRQHPLYAAAAVAVMLLAPVFFFSRLAPETDSVEGVPSAAIEHGTSVAAAEPQPEPGAEPEPAAVPAPALPAPTPAEAAPAHHPEPARIAKRAAPEPEPAPTAPNPERPAEKTPKPALAQPIVVAALVPAAAPLYEPGATAAGPSVRVAAVIRNSGGDTAAVPAALGPAHVGASAREAPNLYWFLPQPSASSVEVTVVDPDAAEPLLSAAIPGPIAAGLHRVSLAQRGLRLRAGVDYRWYVALVRDPERRSQDVVSGAAIRFTPADPESSVRTDTEAGPNAAHAFAAAGYWYDAFDQLSRWLDAEPGAARLQEHRAALLEQVELGDAAAFERRAAASAQ